MPWLFLVSWEDATSFFSGDGGGDMVNRSGIARVACLQSHATLLRCLLLSRWLCMLVSFTAQRRLLLQTLGGLEAPLVAAPPRARAPTDVAKAQSQSAACRGADISRARWERGDVALAVPPSASMASTAAKRGAALGIHGVHGGPPLPPQHRVLQADTLAKKGGRMVDKSWNSKP